MSLLDLGNAVMLGDAATKADSRNIIAELNSYADTLSEQYGIDVPRWENYALSNPTDEKARGFFGRLPGWMGTGILIGGALAALAVGASVVAPGIIASAQLPTLLTQIALISGGVSVTGALFDDEAPDVQARHVEEYANYLDDAAAKLEQAEAKGLIQSRKPASELSIEEQIAIRAQEQPSSHFQDLVDASRLDSIRQV